MSDIHTPYEEMEATVVSSTISQLARHNSLADALKVSETSLGGMRDALVKCVETRAIEYANYICIDTPEEYETALLLGSKLVELANLVGAVEEVAGLEERYMITDRDGQKVFLASGPLNSNPVETLVPVSDTDYFDVARLSKALAGRAKYRRVIWSTIGRFSLEPPEPFYVHQVRNVIREQEPKLLDTQVSHEFINLKNAGLVKELPRLGYPHKYVRVNSEGWDYVNQKLEAEVNIADASLIDRDADANLEDHVDNA